MNHAIEIIEYAKERIYPSELNIKIVAGREMACSEGCLGQVESMLETFLFDANGQGNFSVVAGKGFSKNDLDNLQQPVLVVGDCAIEEVGGYLQSNYKDVRAVKKCSDITPISVILLDINRPDASILADGMDVNKRVENEKIALRKGCNSIFMHLTD